MTQRNEQPLSLACVADESARAAVLFEAVVTLFPTATVARINSDSERVLPSPIDCVVIDSTVNGTGGVEVLRRLRAKGYLGAAVVVRDESGSGEAAEEAGVRLGARACTLNGGTLSSLSMAITDALTVVGGQDPRAVAVVEALRQTQRLTAAGELALRLQHDLNNPLAALLAEAQLLELEALAPDHRASVERIIGLARRVIGVVRELDGVGRP